MKTHDIKKPINNQSTIATFMEHTKPQDKNLKVDKNMEYIIQKTRREMPLLHNSKQIIGVYSTFTKKSIKYVYYNKYFQEKNRT